MRNTRLLIPLIYHPTNVIVLDDKPELLNTVRQMIDHNIPYITETKPDRVLHYLRSHTYHQNTLSQLIVQRDFGIGDKPTAAEPFKINFSHLLQFLDTAELYKKVVVAFIHRQMALRDGLELCREIRKEGLLTVLVLFTGETTSEEVVDAFNKGEIDAYLPKKHLTPEKINQCISEGMWKFFINLSTTLAGLISHELNPLYDEQFFELFEKIRRDHRSEEFYLLDSSCSFLLLDIYGKAKQLFVRNEIDFEDCYEIAKNSEAPYDVLQALRGRQKFPYTRDSMGYIKLQGDCWEDVMVPMTQVAGRELYYSVVDRSGVDVFSFKKYFNEV